VVEPDKRADGATLAEHRQQQNAHQRRGITALSLTNTRPCSFGRRD
jgi:hypothetical protein